MKIKLVEALENRTNYFPTKFTTSELERCRAEGLQFMSGGLTAFLWQNTRIVITDGFDAIHVTTDGEIGQRTQLPIYVGTILDGLGLDSGLDSILEGLNHKLENNKVELTTDEVTYSLGQEFVLTTRNFIIKVNPAFAWVEVKRRNNDFEAELMPHADATFNFYDLVDVMGNHIPLVKDGYRMVYSSKNSILIVGNGDRLEIDPKEF